MKCSNCGSENKVFHRDEKNGILCTKCKQRKAEIDARKRVVANKEKNNIDR